MCGTAIEAKEDAVGGAGPCGAGIGTIEAQSVGGDVFQFAKLSVLGRGGDGHLIVSRGGDGAVGFDVARHYFVVVLVDAVAGLQTAALHFWLCWMLTNLDLRTAARLCLHRLAIISTSASWEISPKEQPSGSSSAMQWNTPTTDRVWDLLSLSLYGREREKGKVRYFFSSTATRRKPTKQW